MRTLLVSWLAILAAACATAPQNEGRPASITEVVTKIKSDLSEYQRYATAERRGGQCGPIAFDIDNVKVSLATQTDRTFSGSGSASAPAGAATVAPSLGVTNEAKGSQTLTFSLYPAPVRAPRLVEPTGAIDPDKYPIAAALQQLRDGLIAAGSTKPCIPLAPAPDETGKVNDPGGTYAFGFTIIQGNTEGVALKLLVFSLGATNASQRQSANTITVTFKARKGSAAIF